MRFSDYQAGDRGQGVTDLQNSLRTLGYPIANDGAFGGETTAAVTHFQEQVGTDDPWGVAGPGTLIAMSSAINEGWKQTGFYYIPGAAPSSRPVPKPGVPAGSPLSSSTPMDRTQLALLGAAGIGVAWLLYSRR